MLSPSTYFHIQNTIIYCIFGAELFGTEPMQFIHLLISCKTSAYTDTLQNALCILKYLYVSIALKFLCCFSTALKHEFQNFSKTCVEVRLTVRCMRRRVHVRTNYCIFKLYNMRLPVFKERRNEPTILFLLISTIVKSYDKCMRVRAA